MSDTTDAPAEGTPTPKDAAEAATRNTPAETPEETIAALRGALAKANAEAKDNRLKASELDQLKQAQMSELEKAQAVAAENAKAAETARAEALRWRIAARHGISDEDAETFLTGTDEDTLTKQAQRLAALAQSTGNTPKPDRSQGGSGQAEPLNGDGLEQALKSKLGIA